MGTYIDVADLRSHLGGAEGVDDVVLEDYIEAIESEIDRRFGPIANVSYFEEPPVGSSLLVLPRRFSAIVSALEASSSPVSGQTWVTLEAADFEVRSPYILERVALGPNPSTTWSPYGVEVTYTPLDDSSERKLCIADVAKFEAGTIGLGSVGGQTIKIGDYSESSGGGSGQGLDGKSAEAGRDAILRRLRHRKVVIA